MVIINGISTSRVAKPNIKQIEQMHSANITKMTLGITPIPNGSGKRVKRRSNAKNLGRPCAKSIVLPNTILKKKVPNAAMSLLNHIQQNMQEKMSSVTHAEIIGIHFKFE